jgi:hypothetical protein
MRALLPLLSACAGGECLTCPAAMLTANDSTDLVGAPGDLISYTWSSEHADLATSAVEIAPSGDRCGNRNGTWVIDTLQGHIAPVALLPCQAGFTYTLSFTATRSANGDSATSIVTISVR